MHKLPFNILIFLLIFLGFFIGRVESLQIKNCEVYNITQKYCEKCYNGYEKNIQDDQCTAKIWIRLIGSVLSLRYVMPIFQMKSILIDFIGQYWFFSINSSQEIQSKEFTSLILVLNQQSLWPLGIKENLDNIIGDDSNNKYLSFMGVQKQFSEIHKKSIKKELFLVDNHNFQFTTSCLIKLCQGLLVLIIFYFILLALDKISLSFTTFKLLQGQKIKGILIVTIASHYYQYVSFYGFHQINSFKGFLNFGQRLNIGITVLVIFIFLFLSISLLPLTYYFNLNENLNIKIRTEKTIQKNFLQTKKLHKILAFSYSTEGFFYYLLDGPFKLLVTGALVGFFQDSTFQYILLALIYLIHYYLLITIYKDFEQQTYFIFRKAFVVVTIFYLLFLEEGMVHIFSHPNEKFEAIRQICLCTLFVLGVLDSLLAIFQFVVKIYKALSNLKINTKKISHSFSNSRRIIQIRNHGRQPSIAEKLLKRLKQAKDSQIMATLPRRKIINHVSAT